MRPNFYYKRTDEYMAIKKREKSGEFPVPLINTAILINLNVKNSKYLTHNKSTLIQNKLRNSKTYDGPIDDQIVFAMSAYFAQIPMYISNLHQYGYVMAPMPKEASMADDLIQIANVLAMIVRDGMMITLTENLEKYGVVTQKSQLSMSKVFVINLEKQRGRYTVLKKITDIIGLDIERHEAVDGNKLSTEQLLDQGIRVIPEFKRITDDRSIRLGDIGQFLSHYQIWESVVDNDLDAVLVIQDNIIFEHYFMFMAFAAIQEANTLLETYDLLYLGRNPIDKDDLSDKKLIDGSKYLTIPGLSVEARAYVLTNSGARKLLKAAPLKKIIPVDEFLALMSDKHSNENLKKYYPHRNLISYAVEPNLVHNLYDKANPKWTSDVEISNDIEDIEKIYAKNPSFKDEL